MENPQYPMTKWLNFDPRLIGLEALMVPFCQHNSSQRQNMNASNVVQAQVIHGCEMPHIASGFEHHFKQYAFKPTEVPQDGYILDVIPKYRTHEGEFPIRLNPTTTVLYRGDEDNKVHSFNIDRYTRCADGFGYLNVQRNEHLRFPKTPIDKGTVFSHSPAIQGEKYCLGVNARVAYMSLRETAEDAFVISRSLANKMASTAIVTVNIEIDPNMVPLNLYGEGDEYKFMPDIGEEVGPGGRLCAFRRPSDATLAADMSPAALRREQPLHDIIYYAPVGAVIEDIDVHINHQDRKKVKTPPAMFAQVDKYRNESIRYHKRVLAIYDEIRRNQVGLSHETNTLMLRSIQRLMAEGELRPMDGRKPPKLSKKGEPIKFIQLTITYSYTHHVQPGFKLTGRDGAKGVICAIWEDEDMPVDDYGFRADLIISPEAVFNRMNLSQLYEQEINRCSEFVRRRVVEMAATDITGAFSYLVDYIREISPSYADQVLDAVAETPGGMAGIVRAASEYIQLICPPGLDTIRPALIKKLIKKYDVPISPVEFNLRDSEGKLVRRVRTRNNVCIGSKYLYMLCKIPHGRSSGVGYINQFRAPVRNKFAKQQSPVGLTPIRVGEDETRNLIMATTPETVVRMTSLYANSSEGVSILSRALLTDPHPSKLDHAPISTERLVKTNHMIKVGKHVSSTVGVDMSDINVYEDEEMAACG